VPLSHFEQCHGVLAEIRARGILLAVDDLGAGYSNLKYIEELNPQVVKLDRQLVAGVRRNSRQEKLVRSIIRLCHDMDAKVVAEGIETLDELAAARDAGADYCQGYLLARPSYPPPDLSLAHYL
jgi:EAL domain-containing protein (putative c-di-GMP-specific phosphodiesterase class I)